MVMCLVQFPDYCHNIMWLFSYVSSQTHRVSLYFWGGQYNSILPLKVRKLFKIHQFVPENPKQSYLDGWAVRRLLRFAFRRQKDCVRRSQTPRETRFNLRKLSCNATWENNIIHVESNRRFGGSFINFLL